MNSTCNSIAALNLFAVSALLDNGFIAVLGFGFLASAILLTVCDVVTMVRKSRESN